MPTREQVLQFYTKYPKASLKEAANAMNSNIGNVKSHRKRLISLGLLDKQDPNQRHDPALIKECAEVGINPEAVSNYWYKGKHFSIHVRNQKISLDDISDLIIGEMKKHSPKYPTIKREVSKSNESMMVISPADIHIGKLCSAYETGDEYNEKIARERVLDGVSSLIGKSKMFGISESLLLIGNDILHTDNAKSTTTSGTFQDSTMMWYDAFNFAFKLYIEVIEMLQANSKLKIAYNPSNHDYVSGFMLARSIESWFRKTDIQFDTSPSHRKYTRFGQNIIGSTHGDGAKEKDLPMLMAHETPYWNECKHRYIYTHHIHHKSAKDYMSVCVESLRSPSGTDSWHHRNGFAYSPKAVEAFIHHKDYGQVSRLTQYF
jgi:hypothetical protein